MDDKATQTCAVSAELSSSPRERERTLSENSSGAENPDDKTRVIIERALSVTSKVSNIEEMGASKYWLKIKLAYPSST